MIPLYVYNDSQLSSHPSPLRLTVYTSDLTRPQRLQCYYPDYMDDWFGTGSLESYRLLRAGDTLNTYVELRNDTSGTGWSQHWFVNFFITAKTDNNTYTGYWSQYAGLGLSVYAENINIGLYPFIEKTYTDLTGGIFKIYDSDLLVKTDITDSTQLNLGLIQYPNTSLILDPNLFNKEIKHYSYNNKIYGGDYGVNVTEVKYTIDNQSAANKPYVWKFNNKQGAVGFSTAENSLLNITETSVSETETQYEIDARTPRVFYSDGTEASPKILGDVMDNNPYELDAFQVLFNTTPFETDPRKGDIIRGWIGHYVSGVAVSYTYGSITLYNDYNSKNDKFYFWTRYPVDGKPSAGYIPIITDYVPTSLSDSNGDKISGDMTFEDTSRAAWSIEVEGKTIKTEIDASKNYVLYDEGIVGKVYPILVSVTEKIWQVQYTAAELEDHPQIKRTLDIIHERGDMTGDQISIRTMREGGQDYYKSQNPVEIFVTITIDTVIPGDDYLVRGYPAYLEGDSAESDGVKSLNSKTGEIYLHGGRGISVITDPAINGIYVRNTGAFTKDIDTQTFSSGYDDVSGIYTIPDGYPHDNNRTLMIISGDSQNPINMANKSFLNELKQYGISGLLVRGTWGAVDENGHIIKISYGVVSVDGLFEVQGTPVGFSGTQIFPDDTKAEWNDMTTSINGVSGTVTLNGGTSVSVITDPENKTITLLGAGQINAGNSFSNLQVASNGFSTHGVYSITWTRQDLVPGDVFRGGAGYAGYFGIILKNNGGGNYIVMI
jgi:hypothetical protein